MTRTVGALAALVVLGLTAHGAPARAGAAGPAPAADSARVVALLAGLRNAACPLPGLATGGQPDTAHLRALAAAGFRGVLDLRAPDEPRGFDEAAFVRATGMRYRTFPVTASTLTDSLFTSFRELMRDSTHSRWLVHCASGNRVGAVLIPWLVLDRGWDRDRARAAARSVGLTSTDLEQRAFQYVERRRR